MPWSDLFLDVCASYAESGSRKEFFFNTSEELLRTLAEWKHQGKSDIRLDWRSTPDQVIDAVEEMIRPLGVEYLDVDGGTVAGQSVEEMIRPLGVEYSAPSRDRSAGAGDAPLPAASAGDPDIPPEPGLRPPLPRPVKILASLCLLVGGLALIDTICAAFQGSFFLDIHVTYDSTRHNQTDGEGVTKAFQVGLYLGMYVVAFPVGVGLFRRSPAWRKLALCAAVVQILVLGLSVYVLILLAKDGTLFGKVGLVAVDAAVLMVSVWSIRVLTRTEVKRVFQPVKPSSRSGLFSAIALVLLLAIIARETGRMSLDYCTLSQKETTSHVKDGVMIRVGDGVPITGSPLQGFESPCLIEVRGMGQEWYRVVTEFNVRSAGTFVGWRTSTHWATEAFGGQATAQVSPALRASADRIVVEVDKPQLSGGYGWPLSKRFTCKYTARIRGEGKYHGFHDEVEAEADVFVSGPCSVYDLKKLLLPQTERIAANQIQEAAKQAAHVPIHLVRRGEQAGEIDRAIKLFNEAIRLDPKFAEAFRSRGRAWSQKKEYDKAIKDYDQAIRLIRLDPTFDSALAVFQKRHDVRSEQEDRDKADERYFAIDLIGRLADSFCDRGSAWSEKKEYDKAIKDYDQAIQIEPRYAEAFNRRGNAWADKEEYDKAIKDYDQAIRFKSYIKGDNEAIFLRNRGLAWSEKKEYDKAIKDYDAAIRLDPKYADGFGSRALAWIRKKEFDKAIEDYDQIIQIHPRDASAFWARGSSLSLKKEYDKAIRDFNEAIRLAPKYASAFHSRGLAWSLKKEHNKAIKDYRDATKYYEEAIRNGDHSAYAVLWSHVAARQAGDEPAAKRFLKDFAGKLDKNWPYPLIQFLRGDIDEGALLKLSTDDDKRTDARCILGLDHAIKGRRGEALAHLRWVKEHGNPERRAYTIAAAELERLERPAKGPPR